MTATPQRIAMQQPVQTRESTAPQLDQAAPWQPVVRPDDGTGRGTQTRHRTPLAVVPAPIRTSGRGFATLCIAILVAALMTVLVTNITVSNRQYELVSLKNEQLDLNQANERLSQQVEHLEAPQNLAAEAATLGMVMPGDVASIDLETGTVTGTATAADAEDKPSDRVAAPAGPAERQAAEAEGGSAPEQADNQPGDEPQDLNGGTIPAPQFSARGN